MVETLGATELVHELKHERTPDPCIMVIFGATGDLTRRKLIPALYNLELEHPMPQGFSVVGFARRPINNDDFRSSLMDATNEFSRRHPVDQKVWDSFSEGIFYHQGEFHEPEAYAALKDLLESIDKQRGTQGNRIFYLATSPSFYEEIIKQLGDAGLVDRSSKRPWSRIIIEKPFGHDLATAKELNQEINKVFNEQQVYRIDHYLGKETVQNILVFRFGNGIFEPIWNRQYIDHVQILVSETLGIDNRGPYYDEAGAIRDMVQNHMLQLLSLVAMEPPVAFGADSVRDEKVKVLHAIQNMSPRDVSKYTVRGQYGPGHIENVAVKGYRQENGVDPYSTTETYVAMKLNIDNWRWAGVPFYLRTGKRLAKRVTEIAIQFRRPPYLLFKRTDAKDLPPNVLSLRIQPGEGISLKFGVKVPGATMQIRPVNMDFYYDSAFVGEPPEAYERLLLDCMLGDSTLFTRRDETEAAWMLVTSILDGWKSLPASSIPQYEPGGWGPEEADEFIARDGRSWRKL